MLTDKILHKKQLADLWHIVFGDEYDYIELIFKPEYKDNIFCFCEFDGDRIFSALYLIENRLVFEGKEYGGLYLYAAATLPEYRGKGAMSRLILQAESFCRQNGYDFISLVPSEESLYSYYSRFGFKEAMYRYDNTVTLRGKTGGEGETVTDEKELLVLRKKYNGNIINFSDRTFSYAVDCMKAAGCDFYRLTPDCFAVFSQKNSCVEEFFSSSANKALDVRSLYDFLPTGNIKIYSSDDIDFSDCFLIRKSGMIYPVNPALERDWNFTDIYMNLALD